MHFVKLLYKTCTATHTNIIILWSIFRYLIVHILIVEKVERLKLVKDEISKIFIHVHSKNPAVKAVNSPSSIHDLTVHEERSRYIKHNKNYRLHMPLPFR